MSIDSSAGRLRLLRRIGLRSGFRHVRRRLWSTHVSLGLRCELNALPPRRPARVEIVMQLAITSARCFRPELDRVTADEAAEVAQRLSLCLGGVKTLYLAFDPDGVPIYAQWLIEPSTQAHLDAHSPGLYRRLVNGEVLVEGAYTFSNFRRLGVMADGMHQLLEIARARGASSALTYVAADYPASIRGCANVGFVLDHVRFDQRRFLVRRSVVRPAHAAARASWAGAVGAAYAASPA